MINCEFFPPVNLWYGIEKIIVRTYTAAEIFNYDIGKSKKRTRQEFYDVFSGESSSKKSCSGCICQKTSSVATAINRDEIRNSNNNIAWKHSQDHQIENKPRKKFSQSIFDCAGGRLADLANHPEMRPGQPTNKRRCHDYGENWLFQPRLTPIFHTGQGSFCLSAKTPRNWRWWWVVAWFQEEAPRNTLKNARKVW